MILALLLAVPILLATPAAGQTPPADPPKPADRFDPDCPADAAALADPTVVEDPELVDEPDGVCPPGESSDPPPDVPDAPPEPAPTTGAPEAAPEPPAGLAPGPVEAPRAVPLPPEVAEELPDRPRLKARVMRPERRESSGGAYAEPDDLLRRQRRRAAGRDRSSSSGGAGLADIVLDSSSLTAAPDFVIRGSSVPRYLRGIYQAAEARYGIRWEILAAINEIETYYGRNLNVSSAGAVGWMQFMPGTWAAYGMDASGDGRKNPYDPEDAIFSAARYLKASGYAQDVRGALFAYNHAGWYVEDVLARARRIAAENVSLPAARRLDPAFAALLTRVARRAGVPWELTLAVLRAQGMDGPVPATRAELRKLVRRLARLGARGNPRGALRRLARANPSGAALGPRLLTREPTFVQRVVALAHYNKAVGREGLVHGLDAAEDELARRVLASARLDIYPAGRLDIGRGVTDVHVLVLLSYLSSRYSDVGVTSLTSGHSFLTASGNVSAHSYGRAVDISSLNGTPILGNQEAGGLTEQALWRILLLPAELEPTELISLFDLGGPSFALADHADHIHAGYATPSR